MRITIKHLLDQMDLIDKHDAQRVDAYCKGNLDRYHELGTEIQPQLDRMKALRNQACKQINARKNRQNR